MSDFEITGMETYEPAGDEVLTDDDGFRYMVDPANGDRLYLLQGEEPEAPAEYFPELLSPDQGEEIISTAPPDARLEWLDKNRPASNGASVPGWATTEARQAWATAKLEAMDPDKPDKTAEWTRYLEAVAELDRRKNGVR